ncbi:MAG TPA: hypothetical protein VNX68_06345 [Nitrosopumilaceae archaeon]|nr:hypothetical protein [Nitrosopumilaceae archaeon]
MNPALYGNAASARPRIPPRMPTRDEILAVQYHFQGLEVNTTIGKLPWWENMVDFLNPSDRSSIYETKRSIGDTHVILDISGNYAEPGTAYSNIDIARDYSSNLSAFQSLVEEAINEGFYVDVRLAGDGQSNRSGTYNDPVGWTYGHDWLMSNFPRIADQLQDYWKYIIFTPGYDGIFYGWEPYQVVNFGRLFRLNVKDGYLGIEHGAGTIPLGEGGSDYLSNGRMQDYDVIFGEFPGWLPNGIPGDKVWQICNRMLENYNRPSDQPQFDDQSHHYYLSNPSPRGRFYYVIQEYDTYRWVRNQVSSSDVELERQYFRNLGAKYVC